LKTLSKKFRKGNSQSKHAVNPEDQILNKRENKKDINKEIIRRLRIQNKKLIEQVVRLKEEIKKAQNNRILAIDHINQLLKIIGT